MLIESILGSKAKDNQRKTTDKATSYHGPVREAEKSLAERDSIVADELGTTLLSKRYTTPEAKALGAPKEMEVATMLALFAEAHKHEPFKPLPPTALEMYLAKHGKLPDGIQHTEASFAMPEPRLAKGYAELFWLCLKIAEAQPCAK